MARLLLLTEMPGSPFIIDERHQRSRDSSTLNRPSTIDAGHHLGDNLTRRCTSLPDQGLFSRHAW